MTEVKAKFYLLAEAGTEPRTTVVKVKTIQIVGRTKICSFSRELQSAAMHAQLFETTV